MKFLCDNCEEEVEECQFIETSRGEQVLCNDCYAGLMNRVEDDYYDCRELN